MDEARSGRRFLGAAVTARPKGATGDRSSRQEVSVAEVDVAVIGAGAVGVSAALHLAREGLDVLSSKRKRVRRCTKAAGTLA